MGAVPTGNTYQSSIESFMHLIFLADKRLVAPSLVILYHRLYPPNSF